MKKSIAVLSSLLIVLSYCPPGSVSMAADDPNMAMCTENTETDQTSSANDENSSVGQVISTDDGDPSSVQIPSEDDGSSLVERFWKKITGIGEKENLLKNPESEIQQKAKIEYKETADSLESGIKNLQIPQKLSVVIDPWEMDRKGQVYSEPYIIRNTGDVPGILTLSNLACKPREESGVVVRTDKEGLHDSGDKYIYMKMLLGNGDRIIFSTEKSQYQTELKPGEELAISFEGEVNENAFGQWKDQDVTISVVYSWEMKEELDGLNLEEAEEEQTSDSFEDGLNGKDGQQQNVAGEGETSDRQQADAGTEEQPDQQTNTENQQEIAPGEEKQENNLQEEVEKKTSEALQTEAGQEDINGAVPDNAASNVDVQQEVSINTNAEDKKEQAINYSMESGRIDGNTEELVKDLKTDEGTIGSEQKEIEEIKNIDLQEPQSVDVNINSWKIDEKGRIVSQQYLVHNAGDTTGIWILSDIMCKPQEQDGVRITTDKKSLHENEEKAVYMELVLGNGKRVVLSQEGSQYRLQLKPGEKISVQFIGEINGNLFENREEGDIAVTAVCSWDIE